MSINRREILASLKCMRCGSRNSVSEYDFHEVVDSKKLSKRTTQYTTAHVYIPICNKCKQDFKKHDDYSSKSYWSWGGFSISSCILFIMFMFFIVSFNAKQPYPIPLQFIMIVLGILDIVFVGHISTISLKARAMVENPKKYMKFIKKQPFVRPMNTMNWIAYSDWLKSATIESFSYQNQVYYTPNQTTYSVPETNVEDRFCGNCGKLISPNQTFCVNCGSKL